MTKALVILIKNPILGKVKTRLALEIGEERALEIYRALLDITRKAAEGVDADRFLYYHEFIDEDDDWSEEKFNKDLQFGAHLGLRMSHAIIEQLESHDKVVVIGSDCPSITTDRIEEAFNALDQADVVLGPSQDGGYYLIGLKRFAQSLFDNISWSTPQVHMETVAAAHKLGWSVKDLDVLNDVDTLADLKQFPGLIGV
jgi:rSAM/selenodomain-associated transferase 1